MLRRIYAVVGEKDFTNFRDRAKAEGLKIDEAFVALVKLYAQGGEINAPFIKKKNHHEPTGVDYLKEKVS